MGKYPVVCVETMVKISKNVESVIHYWKRFEEKNSTRSESAARNLAITVGQTAEHVNADAIVAYTHSGNTARLLAGVGVQCPILAVTDNYKTYQQLSAAWNVTPIFVEGEASIENTIAKGIDVLKTKGILETGDTVALAGGAKALYNDKESEIVSAIMKI